MKRAEPGTAAQPECTKRRLAQGDVASVDACACGVLQVHLGALTLRLTPCAVASLVATLQRALERFGEEAPCGAWDGGSARLPRGRA